MAFDPLDVASYYAVMFAARTDAYSAWTSEGWRPVRAPLTGEIVLAGLTGKGPSISGFLIAPGSVSHVVAIDFDTEDGFPTAMGLARRMVGDGIPTYVEPSRRGSHLWCVLERTAPAVAIRMALRGLLQAEGLSTHDPHIELRPGSDTVADGGLGHALRLPLMPHPKTGFRGKIYEPLAGIPIGRTLAEVILAWDFAPTDRLLAWAERFVPPPLDHIPPEYRNPHDYPEDPSTASDLLRDLWGVPNAAPGRSVKCPAHKDRMPSLSILRDDRRVICKSPGCILNNDDRGRGTYELRKLAPGG